MKKKFTLVEIMIVVAIIAILAAIAVPSLTANREVTLKKAKEDNVRKVQLAKERWAMDYNESKTATPTFDQLKSYLPFVKTVDDLKVKGKSITIGNGNTEPTYGN